MCLRGPLPGLPPRGPRRRAVGARRRPERAAVAARAGAARPALGPPRRRSPARPAAAARPSPPIWQRRSTSATSPGSSRSPPTARWTATRERACWPPATSPWCPPLSSPKLPADTAWHPVADCHGWPSTTPTSSTQPSTGYAPSSATRTSASPWRCRSSPSTSSARSSARPLGYDVGATNLQRVMTRRQMIEPTGNQSAPGSGGGRPAALYRFRQRTLNVTDPFAVFRPPP